MLKTITGVGKYIRQTIDEIRKTVTPTVKQWAGWSAAVFVFVILLMAATSGMDFGFGKLTLWIFG